MRKFISCASALAVVVATSATPVMAATTLIDQSAAAAVSGQTQDAADAACDLLAAAHDTGNGDVWSGVATVGVGTLKAGPTEVVGSRDIDLDTVVGVGFHATQTEIKGDPFRNGGSVNMFGQQIATAAYYDSSTYDFTADFDSTYSFAFTCDISNAVYHPEVFVPGHPVEGFYTNPGTIPSNVEGSCQGVPNTNPHWGASFGACVWNYTGPATDDDYIDAYNSPPVHVTDEFGTVDQDQTETLRAHEDAGSGYQVTGEIDLGKVVVCISPTTTTSTKKGVPGTGKQQNGYLGTKCTTAWFDTGAKVGVTNLNLQGTFISVPPV